MFRSVYNNPCQSPLSLTHSLTHSLELSYEQISGVNNPFTFTHFSYPLYQPFTHFYHRHVFWVFTNRRMRTYLYPQPAWPYIISVNQRCVKWLQKSPNSTNNGPLSANRIITTNLTCIWIKMRRFFIRVR